MLNTPTPIATADFNEEDLLERLMGNEGLARRVAAKFVDDTPKQLAALADAVSRADAVTVRCVAHGIKGSAANVGGMPLSDIASKLERLGETGDLEPAAAILPDLSAGFDRLKSRLERFCDRRD
jgi:HPt (histidine-containing phosphotransfer) domain-containing protein